MIALSPRKKTTYGSPGQTDGSSGSKKGSGAPPDGGGKTHSPCLPDLVCRIEYETTEERVCTDRSNVTSYRVCEEEKCTKWCYDDTHPDEYCCETECVEWGPEVVSGGECTEWDTVSTGRVRLVTENQGCSTSGVSTGSFWGYFRWINHYAIIPFPGNQFLNTDIPPGDRQVSVFNEKFLTEYNIACIVDFYDEVQESNENNNECRSSSQEVP